MNDENIELSHDGAVATITINRPRALNALNQATIGKLAAALRSAEQDETVRVIMITGSGEKAFVAGADINELRALPDRVSTLDFANNFNNGVAQFIAAMRKPVLAAINGFALGGGCELALACDIRLAADNARLGLPEINLGIMPGWGGTQRLARLAGPGTAKLLALSGEVIDAAEALRIGLIDRVYPAAEFRAASNTFAQNLAAKAPLSLNAIKRSINEGLGLSLAEGCALEIALFSDLVQSEDGREGTGAFLEKRQPTWKGC